MSFAAMMIVACAIDVIVGWPDALYRRIGHPVTWIGRLVSALDATLNTGTGSQRLVAGALTTLLVVGGVLFVAVCLQMALPHHVLGILLGGILAWPLVALRSMHDHVAAVAVPLHHGDLDQARRAVSMIVGRDPSVLDEAGVARSALESLAENTSDGIVAPVFWGVLAGLPGIAAYKAVNTLDSMIGHRNPQYEHFGKVAARLDDLINLVPARITGLLFALVSGRARACLKVMWRDAAKHRSPNAGWPESAMASALDRRLSGPRIYDGRVTEEPWLNPGAPDPGAADITGGLRLFRRAMLAMILMCGIAFLAGA